MANLVIQTAYLGDLLLAIPLLKGIRRATKEPLHLVCRKGFGDFVTKLGLADKVFEADKKNREKWSELQTEISKTPYNLVFSPHQSLRTALFVRKLRAHRKIGFKKWWNVPVFTDRVARPDYLPDALRQLSLLGPVDSEIEKLIVDSQTKFHNRSPLFEPVDLEKIPEWASMTLRKSNPEKSKTVFLAPGSTWATKRWTPEGFVRVGKSFNERGYKVILIGSKEENEVCAEIANQMPGSQNLCGTTNLIQLLDLLTTGHLLIANDSGLMHMGSLAGLPTIAVFGPTTLELGYRPWQDRALIVDAELPCRPCGKHGHQQCPLGTHDCMKKIKPEEVLEAADRLLGKGN